MINRNLEVNRLRRRRPRNMFVRGSVAVAVALTILAWSAGGFSVADMTSPQRVQNMNRFLREILPYPARENGLSVHTVLPWAMDLLADRGLEASRITLAIAVAAIVLAGAGALILIMPAARTVASPEPFGLSTSQPKWIDRYLWKMIVAITRAFFIFARAIPEYIWAYLFLAMLTSNPYWPAVLALALHNMGILGKLGSEVAENVEPAAPAALRSLGSSRSQVAIAGLFPLVLPRFLLYFSYRWETCMRDATVLGLLGIASLGRIIMDARAYDRYDEMIFFMILGAVLVLMGELISSLARRFVRRAS